MHTESEAQKFGEPLVDFTLQSLSGGTVTLSSKLVGKKGAVVVVWSSTCSHCIRYDKYLGSFEQNHSELSLIVVSARQGESVEAVRAAAAQRKLSFCLLHDPSSTVARQWLTQQTPRAFLVDSRRALQYRGAIDNYKFPADPEHVAYLEPAIEEFLSGRAISRPETASYGCAIQSVYYKLPRAFTKAV